MESIMTGTRVMIVAEFNPSRKEKMMPYLGKTGVIIRRTVQDRKYLYNILLDDHAAETELLNTQGPILWEQGEFIVLENQEFVR